MKKKDSITRRSFLKTAATAAGGTMVAAGPIMSFAATRGRQRKMRVALVGAGVRGVGMYGQQLLSDYGDYVDLVGICDINPGRLRYAHSYVKPNGPAFTDLDEMLKSTKPEWLIVTSWDWEHHNNIITGMKHGCNIICEKPLTIDEDKCQMIMDAEKKYGKEVIVTFNYRWPPHRAKVKQLLMDGAIGDVTSVDFHWNLSRRHLMQYMRRWHGETARGRTLWVHKSTHHFDMINWYLDSDPEEVFAYADLEQFGDKGPFRGVNCRNCAHKDKCPAYWDITEDDHHMRMYVDNEKYDGYIRDNCVYRKQIDIYDKHSAVVKYANNAYLNYSLNGDTNHSGFWLAFNGTKGRIEGREGGWRENRSRYMEWSVQPLGKNPQMIRMSPADGGHWGGDPLMKDKLFKDQTQPDPLQQTAGTRDGVMSVLAGVAARKSAESGKPVKIAGLTTLVPQAIRPKA